MSSRSRIPQPRHDRTITISGREFSDFGVAHNVYDLPVDEDEEERQDLLNQILHQRIGHTVLVPFPPQGVEEPAVLDCGFGKGAWIDDLLDEHDNCVITGVDLFIGETSGDSPENDDNNHGIEEFIKKRWNLNAPFSQDRSDSHLRPEMFDLINCRCLAEGIDKDRWPALIGEFKRLLRPGGYLQMCEPYFCFQSDNGRLPDASAANAWWSWYSRYMDNCDRDARIGRYLERYCRTHGFEQVTATQYRLPIGAWEAGRLGLGRDVRRSVSQLFRCFALPFIRRAQMPAEVCRTVAMRAAEELSRDDIKAYFVVYVVTARRPRRRR